ncbi:ice-binding family protein [Pedobacter sp.]|uniref:ice-binding family protein n=1 Tax=Pedobacter sp. TaxID=1411316 RepID=UPI003D7F3FD4
MKLLKSTGFVSLLLAIVFIAPTASAATSPGLGAAGTFVILSETYTNTASGTTINGNLGYTTAPAVNPTVNGNSHSVDSTYNQAGIDQGTALSNLNSQPCTFNFPPGNIDLASDETHGDVGVYSPGVYCITGAASIGGGGMITLDGPGTYIFRMDGALTTSANSRVVLANGASACNVWWTPTQATTLGANSTFAGIDIDAAGITIGDSVNWTGRALAFGGTVSTVRDTITAPNCSTSSPDEDGTPNGGTGSSVGPAVPGLPNTGIPSIVNVILLSSLALTAVGVVATLYVVRKKAQSK